MIGGAAAAIGFKDGTDYHEGGLAMVNDQRNAVYKEMVTLPDGSSFIPDGRDVVLNLPRGSKVLRADRTKRLMKILASQDMQQGRNSEDAKFLREMKNASQQFYLKKHPQETATLVKISLMRSQF